MSEKKKIRAGVIGVGNMGSAHSQMIRQGRIEGLELCAVADRNPARREWAARELGADIAGHRSRMLTPELVREARFLVCMTGAHYDRLCELYPNCADKIFTLLPEDVSDPFGGDLDTYRRAAAEIDRGISGIIGRLTE